MSASALITESKVTSVSTLNSVSVSARLSSSALVFRFWQCVTSCLILYFDTLLANLSMSSSDLIWVSISWHVCKIVTAGTLACNSTSVSPSVCISLCVVCLPIYRPVSCSYDGQIGCKFLDLYYCWRVMQCVKRASVFNSVRVLQVSEPSLLQASQLV